MTDSISKPRTQAASSTSAGPERRKHPRLMISVEVSFGSGHHFYAGHTRDVSAGGLFIETDVAIPVGTELTVDLRIPGMHAPVLAEVVWLLLGANNTVAGFGVRFTSMPTLVEKKLRSFMATHARPGYEMSEPVQDEEPGERPPQRPPPLPGHRG